MARRATLDPKVRYRAPRVKLDNPAPRFVWGGVFEGYARRFISQNSWRTRQIVGDEDDALQECAIVFLRCCKTYEGQLTHPAQLMAIYKRALANEWNTLSRKDSRAREAIPEVTEPAVDYNPGFLLAALSGARAEIQSLLKVMADAPAEFLSVMFSDDDAERLNRRIKRLLRISLPELDIVSELRQLLGERDTT